MSGPLERRGLLVDYSRVWRGLIIENSGIDAGGGGDADEAGSYRGIVREGFFSIGGIVDVKIGHGGGLSSLKDNHEMFSMPRPPELG